jgi:hypothetical protein
MVSAADLDLEQILDLYRFMGWSAYTDNPAVLAPALDGPLRSLKRVWEGSY